MPDEITMVSLLDVKPGKADAFRALAAEIEACVRTAEPGTLEYAWSMDAAGTTCQMLERYADSDAALRHLQTFSGRFAARFFDALAPRQFTVSGRPSAALQQQLAGGGPQYLPEGGGVRR